jgi:hypothetical protein
MRSRRREVIRGYCKEETRFIYIVLSYVSPDLALTSSYFMFLRPLKEQ